MKRTFTTERIVIGGLHQDDFEWACKHYENAGYVLVCFEMDVDNYHWNAVYVRADLFGKNYY